jgi:hypothetical protein
MPEERPENTNTKRRLDNHRREDRLKPELRTRRTAPNLVSTRCETASGLIGAMPEAA